MIALIIILFFSIIFIWYIIYRKELAIYYFIPYNYLIDLFYTNPEEILTLYFSLVRVGVILIFFYKFINVTFIKLRKPGFVFFLLLILNLIFISLIDNVLLKSWLETFKFSIILFSFYIILQYFTNQRINIFYFKKAILLICIITIVNIIIANIFAIGWAGYSENVGFFTGALISNMWYVPTLALLGSMALFSIQSFDKLLLLKISSVLVLIIILISFRRSAFAILLLSLPIYLYIFRIKFKFIKNLVLLGLIGLLFFPLYSPIIYEQIEARNKTFERGLEGESRYKETAFLWEERLTSEDSRLFYFGKKPFDTIGNYGDGALGERPIHVDFNIIFFSVGLVGTLLYIGFIFSLYFKYWSIYKGLNSNNLEVKIFRFLFLSVFLSIIFLSFSGGLNAMTFRMFAFFLIALSLGQLQLIKRTNFNNENNKANIISYSNGSNAKYKEV